MMALFFAAIWWWSGRQGYSPAACFTDNLFLPMTYVYCYPWCGD
ncbi:hypothetical protein yruck0001_5720 [Yersinia ruckeri ATCC 29473]|nr:hypothetical protein yruck0001_5720 [Yersinia ruckeri ATCC 29473]